nr:hypothetical protein [uncultured bacterium]
MRLHSGESVPPVGRSAMRPGVEHTPTATRRLVFIPSL